MTEHLTEEALKAREARGARKARWEWLTIFSILVALIFIFAGVMGSILCSQWLYGYDSALSEHPEFPGAFLGTVAFLIITVPIYRFSKPKCEFRLYPTWRTQAQRGSRSLIPPEELSVKAAFNWGVSFSIGLMMLFTLLLAIGDLLHFLHLTNHY